MFTLPPLYGIVNTTTVANPVEFAVKLAEAGVEILQLRAKNLSIEETVTLAGAIKSAVQKVKNRPLFLINDLPEVCRAVGADGVHLGGSDESPKQARALLGPKAIIGFSTHSVEEVLRAPITEVDYLGFGPIFETTTKRGENPVTGLKALCEGVQRSPLPVVAIGGITAERAKEVYATKVASVAVIRDLEIAENLRDRVALFYQASARKNTTA